MGFFDGIQRWQRRRKAWGLLEAGEVEAALRVIGRDEALRHELAEALLDAGKLPLSQALLGHEGPSTLDALLAAPGVDRELERLEAQAAGPLPEADERVLELAAQLRERGKEGLAFELLDRAALARRRWPLLRAALELALARAAWSRAWPLVEAGFAHRKELRGTSGHEALLDAHRRVVTQLKGEAAVAVDLMMRGEVDPFLDDNALLLSRALMSEGPPLTTRLTLVSAPQELREGEERLRSERKNATGLLRAGSAKLRLGELAEAREHFEQARAVAPRHFAVIAGLAATLHAQRTDALGRLRKLPDLAPLAGLDALVPDVAHLTNLELRVVQASVRPLRDRLPRAALALLPLDARVTDLPDFEARRGAAEAHLGRPWDARGGLAGEGLGCVKVEALLETGEGGWALARELAHAVFLELPEAQRGTFGSADAFAARYVRALLARYGLGGPSTDAALEALLSG